MKRFVEGVDRGQSTLFPECLDDWIDADNPVRVIDVFVEALDLGALDFGGVDPKATGRPSYHPSVLLKLYVYGYLNRVQSSRRLEREAGRNVEVMWLTGRRVPDHKTIADFRKDNGLAIRQVCSRFGIGPVAAQDQPVFLVRVGDRRAFHQPGRCRRPRQPRS